MSALFPALPTAVLGRELPPRFRSGALRLADADRVVVDLVVWLEAGDDGGEHALLVRELTALRSRLPSEALDAMLVRALDRAGPAVAAPPAVARRGGLWPALPATVLGERLPRRFRGATVRFADADRVLVALVAWVEQRLPVQPVADGAGRDALVEVAIKLRERLDASPLAAELGTLLERVDVREFAPDGEPFDPDRHYVVGTRRTDDPDRHDRVASTDRPGYVDHGRVRSVAEVILYRRGGGA